MSDVTIPEAAETNYAKSPADIRERAEQIAKTYGFNEAVLAGAICSALVMERERCAKIADDEYEAMKRLDMDHYTIHATKSAEICGAKARTAQSIAQAIRSPHE